MPLYEYVCTQCGERLELFRRMGDHPQTCPECQAPVPPELQLSRSSFQLKGTGWYATDYGQRR